MVPEGWSKVRFEEVGGGKKNAIVDGPFGSNLKSEHYREEGVPVFQSGFVTDGTFNPTKYVYVDEDLFAQQYRSAARGGDILMAKIGAQAGRCAVIPVDHEEGILAGNSLKITPAPEFYDRDFILHWLCDRYNRTGLSEIKSTTAQPAISIKNLKRLWFVSPPLAEQKKIAEILSTWDRAIEVAEVQLEAARTSKRALMQQLLTGKRRFPEFEGEEWKEVRLGDVADTDQAHSFIDGDWVESPHITDHGNRLIQTGNIGIGEFRNNNKKFISDTSFEDLKCKEVPVGCILICRLAEPAGRACIVPDLGEKRMLTSVDVTIFKPDERVANKEFMALLLNLPKTLHHVQTLCGGSTRTRIARSNLAAMKISLPSLSEQERIAGCVSLWSSEVQSLVNQITKLRTEKKALMQQLLTGKRRVVV